MVIVLYAVAEHAELADLHHLPSAPVPLRTIRCGRLDAIVADRARPPSRSVDAAQEHAEAVAQVTDRREALPVRFGSWHPDVDALRSAIAEQEQRFVELVRRVGGAVEYVIRPADATRGRSDPGRVRAHASGRAYLEGRLAQTQADRRARQEAADRLVAATSKLEPLARAHRLVRGHAGIERCFLVPRSDAGRFDALAARAIVGEDLLVGGPWPPYTFVQELEDASRTRARS